MRIFKAVRLIWTFYQNFLLYSMLVTASCLVLFYKYGFSIFSAIFWFKIITLGISYFFVNEYKQKEYDYYHNLGVTKSLIWGSTLIFDFMLFIFLIILVYQFK
jgi:hypothetical protein